MNDAQSGVNQDSTAKKYVRKISMPTKFEIKENLVKESSDQSSTVDEKELDSSLAKSKESIKKVAENWAEKQDMINFSLDESQLNALGNHNSILDLSGGQTSFSKYSIRTDSSADTTKMSADMVSFDSCSSQGGVSLLIDKNQTEMMLLKGKGSE